LIVAGVWIAIDLSGFGLHSSDLREFDPDAVARLETDMWRSYYDRRQILLFFQSAKTTAVMARTLGRGALFRPQLTFFVLRVFARINKNQSTANLRLILRPV
jgi:hypothetical protein